MAHQTLHPGYHNLVERLNRFPQGAPPSDLLYRILEMLFTEREAELVAQVPVKPFTAQQAATIWKMEGIAARQVLDELASRAILLDIETPSGEMNYVLPPPMAGFFEFSMMRLRGDIDQKVLGELFYQYITVEDDFIRALFVNGETQLGRAFVNEPMLPADSVLHVLDYERASYVIDSATVMGVGICYCRHKMQHVGKDCAAPKDICMTFNASAESLVRHGFARRVDKAEGMDLLAQAYAHNLVQFGENVREGVNFICNCCGCCCEAMIAARKFGMLNPVHTTNFIPSIELEKCNGCGKCANICPVEAMTIVSAHDPHHAYKRKAKLNADVCLGCGVCARVCPTYGIQLEARAERVITPVNSTARIVMMAIERGNLQDLIFDNRALFSHRAMAAILGVILKASRVKRALASKQMQSRYLEAILARVQV
ncbi:MAG: 4Fe-4S dicluster domain-containing protein [Chloroflexi bacterium]|nr:4Fe-4S dicluster domain-containing protein [Chloroflexota bacterium]